MGGEHHGSRQGGGRVGYDQAVAVSCELAIVAAAAAAAAPNMLVPGTRTRSTFLHSIKMYRSVDGLADVAVFDPSVCTKSRACSFLSGEFLGGRPSSMQGEKVPL